MRKSCTKNVDEIDPWFHVGVTLMRLQSLIFALCARKQFHTIVVHRRPSICYLGEFLSAICLLSEVKLDFFKYCQQSILTCSVIIFGISNK